MSLNMNWDVDKYKLDHECEEHWSLRKAFMERWKTDYPEERLVCLAQVFSNIEFLGCSYPLELMREVAYLSRDIVMEYRQSKRRKLQRTFVSASDAAVDRAKGVKREGGVIKEAPPPKNAKIAFVRQGHSVTIDEQQDSVSVEVNNIGKIVPVGNGVPGSTSNPMSISQVARSLKIGVRNTTPMTEDQMRLVHNALNHAIIDIESGSVEPTFGGFSHKPGWILVTCMDQASAEWLVGEIPKIKPWDGANLSVIPESELPKPTVVVVFLPSSEAKTVDQALQLLPKQNRGLNVGLWRVLHSRDVENGQLVTFSMDEASVEALRSNDFMAALGFKFVTFKVKSCQDPKRKISNAEDRVAEARPERTQANRTLPEREANTRNYSVGTPPNSIRRTIHTGGGARNPASWGRAERGLSRPRTKPTPQAPATRKPYSWH